MIMQKYSIPRSSEYHIPVIKGYIRMKGIKGFLIDLDGVLYVGDTAIEGAHEAVGLLRKRKYRYRFVSNTTRKCRRTIVERLSGMGFDISEEEVITPPVAANAYMKSTGKEQCYLLVTRDAERDFDQTYLCTPGERIDCVIIGDAGDSISYNRLNTAFRYLMNGAELIALEKDRYWMAPDGLSLSAGPFVTALEFATGKKATIIGKPSKAFFDRALDEIGLRPGQVAMIGDDIITDVAGANRVGMKSILVKTGKYRKDAVKNSEIKPTYCITSLAHLSEIL
jgi:HAD superfamily hydrolase (TIGR01458 family)